MNSIDCVIKDISNQDNFLYVKLGFFPVFYSIIIILILLVYYLIFPLKKKQNFKAQIYALIGFLIIFMQPDLV